MTDVQAISILSIIFTIVFTALMLGSSDRSLSDTIPEINKIKTEHETYTNTTTASSSKNKAKSTKSVSKKTDSGKSDVQQLKNHVAKNVAATSYYVKGKKYYTMSSQSAKDFNQTGLASWYGPGFHGKKTANGEIYNQNAMTAAHKTLPLSTIVKVTNLENKKTVIVRINDRGPYYGNRILDLSKKAADILGISKRGTGKIKLQVIS